MLKFDSLKLRNVVSKEDLFFYFIVVINTIPVLSLKYFLTIDGPSHLYNATLIKDLIFGNSPLVNSLFRFNPVILPNWTGHIILLILSLVFNGALTEKIFILSFLVFLPISFRYMIKAISTSQRNLVYLIFPFTYTYLFEAGFFNFCISFIFMFFTFGYWYKNEGKFYARQIFLFSLLLTLTFFSHILVFGFLEMLISLILIGICIKNYGTGKTLAINLLKKAGVLFIASIPGLILMINFLVKITINSSHERFSFHELLMWVTNVKPLVLFNFSLESKISQYFTLIFGAIVLYSIIVRVKKIRRSLTNKISFFSALKDGLFVTDLILLFSFFILALLFIIPDGASAGMMSERLCLLFFIFLITWLSIQSISKWFYLLLVIATFGVNVWLIKEHYPSYKDLANYAYEINKVAPNIRKETIVYRIDWTDHWMLGHVPDYLGVNNSVVFTSNFEAELKWFPLVYKEGNLPKYLFGDRENIKNLWWKSNSKSRFTRKIDYIFIYGYTGRINEQNNQDLKNTLEKNYSLVYSSSNHVYLLYALKVKKKSEI